jgi:hypothetical protein
VAIFAVGLVFDLAFDLAPVHAQETSAPENAMQEAMKLMMPSDGHKLFTKLGGKWKSQMKIWNSTTPNKPPTESVGESESNVIFGGRYVVEQASGTIMRMPMQRMSILGYDNFRQVYTLVFFSSLETGTNVATGTLDADGKVLTVRGEFDDPTGKTPFKNVIRFESDDVHVFQSYKILPDGKEFKVIEEISTRVR